MENMRKVTSLLFFVAVLVVSGCSATPLPTQPIAETATATIPTLTATPLPATTEEQAIPSQTPEPGLRTYGPYFAYFREANGVIQLVMMDADGGGRKVVELPKEVTDSLSNANYQLSAQYVSPDAKWLAFYTGYAGSLDGQLIQQTFDLTLNLLDLNTGVLQVVTPLLSKNYPNNFDETAKTLGDSFPPIEWIQYAFLAGITHALAWSPDGRHLAFAGQMDGPSSDLYVYDMEKMTAHRLTSGDEELQWIDWSSDGKWILHGSVPWIGEGTEYSIYAVSADGLSIYDLTYGLVDDWLSSHEFLEYHEQNGLGKFELRLVDINTRKITKLWDGAFMDYKVYPGKQWMVIATFDKGLQLIDLRTLKNIDAPDSLPEPRDTFLRLDNGEILPLDLQPFNIDKNISNSPDLKYWVVINKHNVKVYSSDMILVTDISAPNQDMKLSDVQWSPDSSSLFLLYGKNIYSMNIPKGDIKLVETNLTNGYKWINGQ